MADKDVKMEFDVQEALGKLLKALDAGFTNPMQVASLDTLNSDYDVEPKTCHHKWATYNSGFTMYEYCKICDKKKE